MTPDAQVSQSNQFSTTEIEVVLDKFCPNVALKVRVTRMSSATKEFRALSRRNRDCFFPDEIEMDHFPTYSKADCILECAWKAALRLCQCVPWFLREFFPEAQVCHIVANICFRNVVEKRYTVNVTRSCIDTCLDDCEPMSLQLSGEQNCHYASLPSSLASDYFVAKAKDAEGLAMQDILLYPDIL